MVTRVPIYLGGTGESTQAAAQAALGLHTSNSVAFTTVTIGAVNVLANDYATLLSAYSNDVTTLATARGNDHATLLSAYSNDVTTLNTARANDFATYTAATNNVDIQGTFSDAKANIVAQTLTDAATIAWDTSLGRIATITLGASRTFGAPTNLKVGTYILHVIQGGTGSYTITWNGVFKWTAATAPTLSTAVGRRDVFSFISDGTNLYGAMIPDVR